MSPPPYGRRGRNIGPARPPCLMPRRRDARAPPSSSAHLPFLQPALSRACDGKQGQQEGGDGGEAVARGNERKQLQSAPPPDSERLGEQAGDHLVRHPERLGGLS